MKYTEEDIWTSAVCPRCGKLLQVSELEDYSFQCLDCDEDFYGIEVREWNSDLFEFSPHVPADFYNNYSKELHAICDDACAVFLGVDDSDPDDVILDIGWTEIPSSNTIHYVVNELLKLLNNRK